MTTGRVTKKGMTSYSMLKNSRRCLSSCFPLRKLLRSYRETTGQPQQRAHLFDSDIRAHRWSHQRQIIAITAAVFRHQVIFVNSAVSARPRQIQLSLPDDKNFCATQYKSECYRGQPLYTNALCRAIKTVSKHSTRADRTWRLLVTDHKLEAFSKEYPECSRYSQLQMNLIEGTSKVDVVWRW